MLGLYLPRYERIQRAAGGLDRRSAATDERHLPRDRRRSRRAHCSGADARQPETVKLAIESFERVKASRAPDTLALLRVDIPRPETQGGGFAERYWSIVASPVLDALG